MKLQPEPVSEGQTLVGTLVKKDKRHVRFKPDNPRIWQKFSIEKAKRLGAKAGDKVVIQATRLISGGRVMKYKIVDVLGSKDDPKVASLSIMKNLGFSDKFPDDVSKAAKRVKKSVTAKDLEGREDLRHLNIVTIDGDDAKDLDDAISVSRLDNGNYRLGVHIADVSHYVKQNSALDKEAFKRGTSVYLVGKVLPMLPKELSNGICSLTPGKDRLTLSVFMEITDTGDVVAYNISESVIHSKERMTYEIVTKILQNQQDETLEKYYYLKQDFRLMAELARILNRKRKSRGSIDFDFPECKITLDKDQNPVDVQKYQLTESNNIIEEFMLLTNETIAKHVSELDIPFVYRVHENPSYEKLDKFNRLLVILGHKMISKPHPKAFQNLLNEIQGQPDQRIISTIMLRSLMKARYHHRNKGHFGLALEYYCHFTSPIRRYPDLIIHRIIKSSLKNKSLTKKMLTYVQDVARQSSEMEILAQDAERQDCDLKKTEFMKGKEGQVFDGIISTVGGFGFYVELDNTIEGLVHIKNLSDDYYIYDADSYKLTGNVTKKVYKIGDHVRVMLICADTSTRNIDFVVAD